MSKKKKLYNTVSKAPPALKLHRDTCMAFWNKFRNGSLDKRKYPSHMGRDAVLNELIRLGQVIIAPKRSNMSPSIVRHQYDTHKKKLKGYNNFEVCFACGDQAKARHHIIWIKNGGRNTRKNICPLCYPCHAEIHPWLKT